MGAALQLPLPLQLKNGATFANFVASGNEEALAFVRGVVAESGPSLLYLCGGEATGKTHLLAASCHYLREVNGTVSYLPLRRVSMLSPALMVGLEQLDLLCIDDVDVIAGNHAWEEALFHLYNRVESVGGRLMVAGRHLPNRVGFVISDLVSRFTSGVVFRLHSLDDQSRAVVLQSWAEERGLEISDEVTAFLLTHFPRDLHTLADLVERLDHSALAAKRRVTVPFVKSLFVDSPRQPHESRAKELDD